MDIYSSYSMVNVSYYVYFRNIIRREQNGSIFMYKGLSCILVIISGTYLSIKSNKIKKERFSS